MAGDDEGHTELTAALDDCLLDKSRALLIHAGRRLVEDQHPGPQDETRGERDPLGLAPREFMPPSSGEFIRRKPHQLHRPADPLPDILPVVADPQAEGDILEDGAFEQIRLLEEHGDVPLRPSAVLRHRRALESDLPPFRRFDKGEEAQKGGLPAPVRTRETDGGALLDGQFRHIELEILSVPVFDIRDLVERRHGVMTSSSAA